MSPDVIEVILDKLESIEKEIKELTAFKNKVMGMGVAMSAIFALIFDLVRDFFTHKG